MAGTEPIVISRAASSPTGDAKCEGLLPWCYLLNYRGKLAIDYPAQGDPPYNLLHKLCTR